MKPRVAVIGAGNVGAEVGRRLVEKDLAQVVLVDIINGLPQGKALDIFQSAPIEEFNVRINGSNNFEDLRGSEVVVITAGLARKPGMTREDLQNTNAKIIKTVVENIKKYAPDSIILMVTNPLDIMTQVALKVSGFSPQRVFGMAGILDCARFAAFTALELNVFPAQVKAMVLGGHGDAMLPLPRFTKVGDKLLTELLSPEKIEALIARTRDGGAEIVKLLKTGSAYYAPSAGAAYMVECILKNKKEIIPSSVYLTGQYGLADVYIGVPARIGRNGVEEIIELELTKDEMSALHKSAQVVKANFQGLNLK